MNKTQAQTKIDMREFIISQTYITNKFQGGNETWIKKPYQIMDGL